MAGWEAPYYQGYDYMPGPQYLQPQPEPVILPAARPAVYRRSRGSDDYSRAPMIYQTPAGAAVVGQGGGLYRSRSTGHRPPPAAPAAIPVVINNNIAEEDLPPRRGRYLEHPDEYYYREPSHGRHRAGSSRDPSPGYWRQDMENDHLRKEVLALKAEKERKAEEARIKKDMELEIAMKEKKARDDKEKEKVIGKHAIAEFKRKELEEKEKKKKEEEVREKEYRERLQRDLGLSETQITKIVKKDSDKAVDLRRTTYTKIARRHVSIDTLRAFDLPFKLDDREPDLYVLIKRWVPEYEQELLWDHTRRLREEREVRVRRIELKRASEEVKAAKLVLARKKDHRSKSPGLFGFLK